MVGSLKRCEATKLTMMVVMGRVRNFSPFLIVLSLTPYVRFKKSKMVRNFNII